MDFSVDNIKKNLKWLVGAFLGLFHFVWLAIPFANAFVAYDGKSQSEGISGYTVIGEEFAALDAGFLASLFQALALGAAVLLLAISAYMIIKNIFGIELPEKLADIVNVKKVGDYTLLVYGALNVLVFISIIIVCLCNTRSLMGMSAGIGMSFGTILVTLLSAGSAGFFMYLEKKNPDMLAGSSAKYVCQQCGAPAKAGAAFCASCGGAVVEVAPQPKAPKMQFVCQQCGEVFKKEAAFCSKCGGKVEAQLPPVWCCENCGDVVKEGVAFCSKCGGKIIKK